VDQAARAARRDTRAAKRRRLTGVAVARRPQDSFLPISASAAAQECGTATSGVACCDMGGATSH
jgi:hypothetical protein